jgi:glutaredoxin-like protein
MEKFLDEDVTHQLSEVFSNNLKEPVRLIYFLEPDGCESCNESIKLLNEVADLSEKISVEVHDMGKDADLAAGYHIENAPGFVIAAEDDGKVVDYGIRYAGTPAGYEFTSLINDLVMVSQRDSGLAPDTRQFLKELDKEVKLQVFVTPTCPYCPASVNQAHAMAMESAFIQA